jgi:putative membrane protein
MRLTLQAVALAASLCVAGAAAAQSGQQQPTPPQTPSTGEKAAPQQRVDRSAMDRGTAAATLAKADRDFMKQAAQNGHAEIEASKLAQTKATQPDIKSYAQKMVAEHTKTHQELAALAQSKGVDLPDGPSLMQRAKLKMLSAADGEKFDERYAENFGVKAHEDTIKLFREGAEKAQDAEVKAFAQKTLPHLQEHLTMAKAVHASATPTAAGRTERSAERSTERSAQRSTERSTDRAGDRMGDRKSAEPGTSSGYPADGKKQ